MLSGLKVLIVEDQVMIAMDVELMLYDGGAASVQAAASVNEALATLVDFHPDVAVLDINLWSETSLPIAEALMARNIPFIFATGYGDTSILPESMAHVFVLHKPYHAVALTEAITQSLNAWAKATEASINACEERNAEMN